MRIVLEAEAGTSSLEARPGERLVDTCDEARAAVPFSCRAGHCGTCRVDVLAGGEALAPPDDDERAQLAKTGDDPARTRLACVARLTAGARGPLRLRVRGP